MPVEVAGIWRYVYRAVDEHGQGIDVLESRRRDIVAVSSFLEQCHSVSVNSTEPVVRVC